MSSPIVVGFGVAAAALLARSALIAHAAWKAAPPMMRQFYKGGFGQEMTRREAALVLGIRESSAEERIKAAHKRIMVANHPDSGGSAYLATKVNEAKDVLLGKKSGGSVF